MKKSNLLSIVLVIICAFFLWRLISCDDTPADKADKTEESITVKNEETTQHEHVFNGWTSDKTNHWHLCVECEEQVDMNAHTFDGNGVCTECGYSIYSSGLEYSVSDDGTYCIVKGIGTCSDDCIVIPPVYQNLPVKEIRYSAFYGCHQITGLVIPNSVEIIGDSAFRDCYKLSSITFGNGIKYIKSFAFFGCSHLTNVEIPDSIEIIGENAFTNCSRLTSVTLGSGLRAIGKYAFNGCSELQSVVLKNTVGWKVYSWYEEEYVSMSSSALSPYNVALWLTLEGSPYEFSTASSWKRSP